MEVRQAAVARRLSVHAAGAARPGGALTRVALVVAAAIVAGFVWSIERSPVAWSDDTIYASVARSVQLGWGGVPSVQADDPAAVDHVRFYGPVFFSLAALSFRWFGVSLASLRAVPLAGALAIAAAGALLAAAFGADARRRAWVAVLLLLTPEVGSSATNGRMDALAVGLALLGLAVFVRAAARAAPAPAHGAGAGLLLAAAALTTPRLLPLLGAFVIGGLFVIAASADARRSTRLFVITIAVCAAALTAWSLYAHGGPIAWARALLTTANGVGVDAALAPGASRDWRITPWTLISPAIALAGGTIAAAGLASGRRGPAFASAPAAAFAVVIGLVNLLLGLALFNGTFAFGVYFAVPLLAVVAALPWQWTARHRAAWAAAFTIVLAVDGAIRIGKSIGVAATWDERDPRPLDAFVRAHVPAGSDVYGEPAFYFFAVERADAHLVSTSGAGFPEWTTMAQPAGPRQARPPDQGQRRAFLLWPAEDSAGRSEESLPAAFACAAGHGVGTFEPAAPAALTWLGPYASVLGTRGYPRSRLYEIPPACAATYATSSTAAHAK